MLLAKKYVYIEKYYKISMKLSAVLTVILGTFGTILLIVAAATTNSGNIKGAESAVNTLFHFIVVLIALPFLLKASKTRSKLFERYISVLAVLNAILMLIASGAVSGNLTIFYVAIILELLPILIFYLVKIETPTIN